MYIYLCVVLLSSIFFLAQKIHSEEQRSWGGQLRTRPDLGVTVRVNMVKIFKYICVFQDKHKKINKSKCKPLWVSGQGAFLSVLHSETSVSQNNIFSALKSASNGKQSLSQYHMESITNYPKEAQSFQNWNHAELTGTLLQCWRKTNKQTSKQTCFPFSFKFSHDTDIKII